MRIAAYVRVSSEAQADNLSIPTQIRLINEYAARQGWPEPTLYEDRGKSAYNDDLSARPAFARLIADAEAGQYTHLLITDLDRLARNTSLALIVADRLSKAGCRIVSLNQASDFRTPDGRLLYTLSSGFNEYASAQISRKTRAGLAHIRAQGGHVGGLPYGARRDATRRLTLDPAVADTLALILALAAAGSLSGVATELNRRDIPTKTGAPAWAAATISSIVKRGRWLLDQPAPWPARWLAAANRPRHSHANRNRRVNELSAMLWCACGGTIAYSGYAPRKRGEPARYSVQCRHWTKERPNGLRCAYRKTYATHYEGLAGAALLALPDLTAVDLTPPDLIAARASLRVRRIDLARAVRYGLPDDEAEQTKAALDAEEAALPLDSGTERALAEELLVIQAAWPGLTAPQRNAVWRRIAVRIVITGRALHIEWTPALRRLLDQHPGPRV